MGDGNSLLDESQARHLLRRTSFGGAKKASEVDRLVGQTRREAADKLLRFRPSNFKPRGDAIADVHDKWVKKMVSTRSQLQEKLVVFWHDHFATSNDVIADPEEMSLQNQTLRLHCKGAVLRDGRRGSFKDFVKAINKDPAMTDMLDIRRSSKEAPNENYPRELMELFTLGVFDVNGNPNYSEEDVQQIARAFTGWRVNGDHETYFDGGTGDTSGGCSSSRTGRHDYSTCYPSRGPKVIFKDSGGFGPGGRSFTSNGEGAAEIDTVIDVIFEHRDSDGQNTVARYIGRRLFEYFAYADPDIAVLDAIIAASQFDTSFLVEDFLRELFCHDEFYACAAPPGMGTKKSVKWPVDLAIGTIRLLRMRLSGSTLVVNGGGRQRIRTHLDNMGLLLLQPPSVFGWDLEEGWLSSATMLGRFAFARDLIAAREGGPTSFQPEDLMDLGLTDPVAIVTKVTDILGISDQLTEAQVQALIDYMGPGPVNLNDATYRNRKLHGLFGLALQSPAYQLY